MADGKHSGRNGEVLPANIGGDGGMEKVRRMRVEGRMWVVVGFVHGGGGGVR